MLIKAGSVSVMQLQGVERGRVTKFCRWMNESIISFKLAIVIIYTQVLLIMQVCYNEQLLGTGA